MLSPKKQELKDKLYSIWNDRDFVMGVGVSIASDQEAQEMIDFIDSDSWKSFSDITLKALTIERLRN